MFLTISFGTTMILFWFAIIIVAAAIEANTMDLSSIWFSAGALFALIIAMIWDNSFIIQFIVFIVVSIGLLLSLRPVFKEHLKKNEVKTNADALIGKTAICLKDIKNGERGEVKIEGKIWSAISNEDINIEEKVTVLAIKGNKLVVRKD